MLESSSSCVCIAMLSSEVASSVSLNVGNLNNVDLLVWSCEVVMVSRWCGVGVLLNFLWDFLDVLLLLLDLLDDLLLVL